MKFKNVFLLTPYFDLSSLLLLLTNKKRHKLLITCLIQPSVTFCAKLFKASFILKAQKSFINYNGPEWLIQILPNLSVGG